MPSSISKTQRWIDLIAYLAGRRVPVAASEILERLPAYAAMAEKSAERVFERDKKALRQAGFPLTTVRYRISHGAEEVEGYSLASGDLFLPYLRLIEGKGPPSVVPARTKPATVEISPEDAREVFEALSASAAFPDLPLASETRRVLAKLKLGVEPEVARAAPVYFADSSEFAGAATLLPILGDAVLERRQVRFRYRGMQRDVPTERQVLPYGLLFAGGSWYLIGFDEARAAIREFRVSRIESPVPSETAGDFEVPPDFSLRAYQHRQAWELGDEPPVTATVRFLFPRSLWAERNRLGELLREESDGVSVRCFTVRQVGPFVRWLLTLVGEAEPVSPPEIRQKYRSLAQDVAALY